MIPFIKSCHNFEKFSVKVVRKGYFNVFWHIITMIHDVLEKFHYN